jgi:hypothetical protein
LTVSAENAKPEIVRVAELDAFVGLAVVDIDIEGDALVGVSLVDEDALSDGEFEHAAKINPAAISADPRKATTKNEG